EAADEVLISGRSSNQFSRLRVPKLDDTFVPDDGQPFSIRGDRESCAFRERCQLFSNRARFQVAEAIDRLPPGVVDRHNIFPVAWPECAPRQKHGIDGWFWIGALVCAAPMWT